MSEKKKIRVSYVLSTRNRAEFLDKALDNVREFITADDELIVIDGGSTDHTAKVIEKHRDIVSFFKSEADFGEAHGYNKGILESKGCFIKVLTDDDYIYPEAMRYAISVMEKHPGLDAILCGGEECSINPVTREVQWRPYKYLPPFCTLVESMRNMEYVNCGLGLIIRRKSIALVGLFDTTFRVVDTDYLFRLIACHAKMKYLNIKLFRHVEYPHSGMHDTVGRRRDYIRLLLRNKAWDKAMKYPWCEVVEVLGLSDLPGGDSLMQVVWYLERWRQGRLRPFLFPLARFLGTKSWYDRLRLKVGSYRMTPEPQVTQRPDEPVWDGSLR